MPASHTYLLAGLVVLRQLDLAHAARTDGLAERPCSRSGGRDGRPALGWLDGLRAACTLAGHAVGGHCAGCRGV